MAAPNKKRVAAMQRRKMRITSMVTNQIRRKLIGATLTLAESDGPDAPVRLAGFEPALRAANNNADLICEITTSWCLNWQIVITVKCQKSKTEFYEQDIKITVENQGIKSLNDLITAQIDRAKSLCNPKHIIDTWWIATVTE